MLDLLDKELRADAFRGWSGDARHVLDSLVGALLCPFSAVLRSQRRNSVLGPRTVSAPRSCMYLSLTAWRSDPGHQRANEGFSWVPDAAVLGILRSSDQGRLESLAKTLRVVADRAMWVISDPKYTDNQFQYVTSVAHILPDDGSLPLWLTQGPDQVQVIPTSTNSLRFAIYQHALC